MECCTQNENFKNPNLNISYTILKSLVILAIWLALNGAIYSQIVPFLLYIASFL